MGIARSTYYDAPAARIDDVELLNAITAICDEFEAYGWHRVQAALRHRGVILDRRGLAVALGPSELAGIAETERARVV